MYTRTRKLKNAPWKVIYFQLGACKFVAIALYTNYNSNCIGRLHTLPLAKNAFGKFACRVGRCCRCLRFKRWCVLYGWRQSRDLYKTGKLFRSVQSHTATSTMLKPTILVLLIVSTI